MKDARRLTLEEKVGQLFVLGFQGYIPDAETRELHQRICPGGFILFQRNLESFDQVYSLTAKLRETSPLPSLVAIEQEGGSVDRLKHIFAPLPSVAAAASAGTAQVRLVARIIASQLEASGISVSLAPVADISQKQSIVPERMFGPDASEVARLAGVFVEELSKKNIIACARHFPGIGHAASDPHFVLPRIDRTRRQLIQEDVAPFVSLLNLVPMMMVSHAYYPAFGDDKPTPASLSQPIIEGFLRKKLGFTGIVMTDDLTMGAISSLGLTADIFARAFEAGNDMLLFSQTTPLVEEAFTNLVRVVRASAVLHKRLDASVERIVALKSRIPFLPLRYRAHLRTRIVRQIEKLRAVVPQVSFAPRV